MLLEIKNVFKQVTEPSGEIITVSHAEHLMLDKGGQMLLTGPSGSGKTTLLHMIAGLLSPSGGEIYFDGARIDDMPEKERDLWRARNIGYVFQKLNLIEALTAEENILLAGYFAGGNMAELKKRAAGLLERVGLANKKDTLPGKLSIGEQQRIAVVRAVINKPVLLLADEPTLCAPLSTSLYCFWQMNLRQALMRKTAALCWGFCAVCAAKTARRLSSPRMTKALKNSLTNGLTLKAGGS